MIGSTFAEAPKLTRSELIGTLAGMLLSLLLAALDQTIVGTAMPRIIAQLHGFERYAWVTAAYLVGSTLAVPIFARLSDLYGRKKLFIGGVILFIVSSACCGAAGEFSWVPLDGMNQLIAFRAFQGVGGGMMTGLIFTIIGDIFSPSERGRYQGLFAAVIGFSSIVGPALGGWITDHLSWRWTFYVNLPVGLLAVAVLIREFPDIHPMGARRGRIDWAGVGLLCAWLIPLLIAFTFGGQTGWSSPVVVSLLAVAAVMLAAFIAVEARTADALLPFSLFRDRVILVSCVEMFILGAALFGVVIYLPLFVQAVLGVSATASGSLLTPMMLTSVLMSVVAGQVLARVSRYKAVGLTGSALMFAGAFLLSRMDANTALSTVVRNSVIVGLGFGLVQPLYTWAVQNVAPRTQMGAATAAAQFARSIGCTVGVAVFGSVLLVVYQAHLSSSLPPEAVAGLHNPLYFRETVHMQMPEPARDALASALRFVFASAAGLLLVAFSLNVLLPSATADSAREVDRLPPGDASGAGYRG